MSNSAEVPDLQILAAIADAVIFADTDGVVRHWNDGAHAVFGFAQSEALGQNLDLIVPEELREAHWRGFDAALERGATTGGRRARLTKGLHADPDRALYVEMSFALVYDADGAVAGSVAVARDVTERHLKAREERAARRRAAAATNE
ncbi:PAS domain-containing protein [Cumulibacter soli]|uniref:PAS domain-containing protein n=1 Tax=Cumulibacter soli TaxID=2546344 RepID=UPI0010679B66|nr:PAS domain S-box protein [Cumulibacter soli]